MPNSDPLYAPRVRVVITGLGAVTPVGLNVPGTWEALVAGRSGLGAITHFDAVGMGFESRVAGEVKGFEAASGIDKRHARRMDRVMQLALVASREALANAGLFAEEASRQPEPKPGVVGTGAGAETQGLASGTKSSADTAWPSLDPNLVPAERVGVFIGTGVGGVATIAAEERTLSERGPGRVSPFTIPMLLADSVPGCVAIQFGLKGPNMAHLSACASGANAIGEAFEAIRRGAADVMVAGGSEAAITPMVVAGFQNMGALSKWQGEPALASRPFDKERDGFVIGEGAGIVVLERLDHALARGAHIYAELAGYGSTADAGHVTAPAEDGAGIRRAMHLALDQAGLTPADIAYINAHGTSTPLNDAVESHMLHLFFGDQARRIPISSTKSMIGHLLGAGGAVEAVVCAETVASGTIHPTINRQSPDPVCDLDYVTEGARRPAGGVPSALSLSMGFGGHNAALLFTAYPA